LVDFRSGQSENTLRGLVDKDLMGAASEDHPEDCSCGEIELDIKIIPAGTTGNTRNKMSLITY